MTQTLGAPEQAALRLTHLSSCAGCAAKLPQAMLSELLTHLADGSLRKNSNALVGADHFDDAAVYRLQADLAIVQTVDFFTPIVDDAYDFGQIAAANAISDIYAMGGRPIMALNLLGIPADKVPPQAIAQIIRGGAAKAAEASCAILGGHTIRLPEPVYGMSVTGTVHPGRILSNDRARPGDLLILTKPIGTGIATTAIKRDMASLDLAQRATDSMKRLNTPGEEIANRQLAFCATDITGFGLLGHLANIVRASSVSARITASAVPSLSPEVFSLIEQDAVPGGTRANLTSANEIADWGRTSQAMKIFLSDAQTSGGLLLCVSCDNLQSIREILRKHATPIAAVIGEIISSNSPQILVQP
jgi:selenide,water dikinase